MLRYISDNLIQSKQSCNQNGRKPDAKINQPANVRRLYTSCSKVHELVRCKLCLVWLYVTSLEAIWLHCCNTIGRNCRFTANRFCTFYVGNCHKSVLVGNRISQRERTLAIDEDKISNTYFFYIILYRKLLSLYKFSKNFNIWQIIFLNWCF